MKTIIFLIMILIGAVTSSTIFAREGLIEVYDGRETFPELQKPTADESLFFYKVIKEQRETIAAQLKTPPPAGCQINPLIRTAFQGSFTTPNSSQKAYLYYVICREKTDENLGNGVMIVENDQIVFNKFYFSENLEAVKKLPDINKNGLSELVFISSTGSSVRDYSEIWLDIVECQPNASFDFRGKATVHRWYGLSARKDDGGIPGYIPTAYKIFVEPSVNPAFSRETYRNVENKWVLTKKLEKLALTKDAERLD